MPLEAPTNCWTSVEDQFAAAIAEQEAFWLLCEIEADDPDRVEKARAHVFLDEIGESLTGETWTLDGINELGAWCIVGSAPQGGYRFDRTTADGFSASGNLMLFFGRPVPPEAAEEQDDPQASRENIDRTFKNRLGSTLQQLAQWMNDNGGPWIRSAEIADGPYQNAEEEWEQIGRRQGAEAAIAWGVLGGGGAGG